MTVQVQRCALDNSRAAAAAAPTTSEGPHQVHAACPSPCEAF